MGTAVGYESNPEFWKQGLDAIESPDIPYTSTSLCDVYVLSLKHALELIEKNGGDVGNDSVRINIEQCVNLELEQSFEGHYPISHQYPVNQWAAASVRETAVYSIEGIGFSVQGRVVSNDGADHVIDIELYIDEDLEETVSLPYNCQQRRETPLWKFNLRDGQHKLRFRDFNPTDAANFQAVRFIRCGSSPASETSHGTPSGNVSQDR